MANIYKAMAPFWVEVLILSPEDTAIFLNSRQDKNGEKIFLLARTPVIYEELIEHGVHISEIVLAEKKYLPQKRNALRAGRTDVHTRPLSDCLQSFQHLNLTFVITLCVLFHFICHILLPQFFRLGKICLVSFAFRDFRDCFT